MFWTSVLIGGLAWRAASVVLAMDNGILTDRPLFLLKHRHFATYAAVYMFFIIVGAAINGWHASRYMGMIGAMFLTWGSFQIIDLVMVRAKDSLLTNPIMHFLIFAPAYFVVTAWSAYKIIF